MRRPVRLGVESRTLIAKLETLLAYVDIRGRCFVKKGFDRNIFPEHKSLDLTDILKDLSLPERSF
jgi:hypothetical protein